MIRIPRRPASLAIIGSYPPPYGGVGIHTQRLCALLDQRGIDYVVYNATSDVGDGKRVIGVHRRRKSWLLKYLFTAREPAIYFMSGRLSAWVIAALLATWRGKRVFLRLRNASLPDWMQQTWLKRTLCEYSLRRMDGVICVSQLLLDTAKSLGVEAGRLHWSPGFLPPKSDDDEKKQVAPEVWRFIESHSPILSANGKVDWYNGNDLYGFDHCIELAIRLKQDHPRIGVVVCFADHNASDETYLDTLRSRAREAGVADNIVLNTRVGVFVPVLAASSVFLRPSNTDGDAISVREALYLGIPTVASDCVVRPAGAIVFPTRDMDCFEACVREALAISRDPTPKERRLTPEDDQRINRYLDLLTNLAQGIA